MKHLLNAKTIKYFFGGNGIVEVILATAGTFNLQHPDAAINDDGWHYGLGFIAAIDMFRGFKWCMVANVGDFPSYVSVMYYSPDFPGRCMTSVPLRFAAQPLPDNPWFVYRHSFTQGKVDNIRSPNEHTQAARQYGRHCYEAMPGKTYVGMTGRNPYQRWAEHHDAAFNSGTYTRYAEGLRDMEGKDTLSIHDIVAVVDNETDCRAIEKDLIAKKGLYPTGFNMRKG